DELTALGHLYGLVALGVFLALDGPLAVVRALAESFRVVPAGVGLLGPPAWSAAPTAAARFAFGRVGAARGLGVGGAAPVALAVARAGVALGLLGRAAPSLQRAALAWPVRAALGLVLVLLGLGALAAALAAAWSGWPGPVFEAGVF